MSTQAANIATPLAWLKSEIDRSIVLAREALAQSLNGERETLLAACEQHLRQSRGALDMLELDGAARFCAAIEQAVRSCAQAPARPTVLNVSVMDRAMFALAQFLDDLAKGESDVPLKLFPLYRELVELAGRTEVTENELFFPDLTPAPAHNPIRAPLSDADLSRHLLACRSHFQRGLLAWHKQPAQAQGLQAMRSALDALDLVARQLDTPPGLWWAATALIDVLMQPDERIADLAVKPLLGRLERLMRDVATGERGDAPALMRDMLYPLALATPVSRRVREVKNLYRLDTQVPEYCVSGTLEYDLSALAPVLDDMRRRLSAVEEAWVKYTSGGGDQLRCLRDEVSGLKAIARDMGHYRLVRLLDIVSLIASKLPDPYPQENEVLALEMAAAFLFTERMLDHFTSPPADIDQQVAVMVGWLLDAVKPRGDAIAGALRDDITQRQNFAQIRGQVAREILENLRQVEQTVDQIARDPGMREAIATLEAPVRQIAGALKMLGLSRANGVLSACLHLMKLSVCDEPTLTRASLEWVADGLSCLGFYLQALQNGDSPSEDILLGFVHRLASDDARPAGSTGWVAPDQDGTDEDSAAAPLGGSSVMPMAEDEPDAAAADLPAAEAGPPNAATASELRELDDAREIRAVYIQEAEEVLAGLAEPLSHLHAAPSDLQALAAVRRSFHTLKGGGRLIGQHDLGELAWAIEQTLNHWLDRQSPASTELLALIGTAANALRDSVQQLGADRSLDIDRYPAIVEHARALREPDGSEGAQPQAPDERSALAAEDLGEAAAEVVIGEVRLSETLFQIYLRESAAHLGTLDAELDLAERESAMPISDALLRAAHTLKSSSGTTGFAAVVELSAALEECLQALNGAAPDQPTLEALGCARLALVRMLGEIGNRCLPARAVAEEDDLRRIARLALATEAAAQADTSLAEAANDGARSTLPDELDPHLLPVFLDEAGQLVPQISSDFNSWRAHPGDIQPARALARALHTLKGSARMAGAMRIGELTHAIESRIGMTVESGDHAGALFADLQEDLDRVAEWIDALHLSTAAGAESKPAAGDANTPQDPLQSLAASTSPSIRIDAEVLDKLVNQAGEISIARNRIEGELETLKQSLHDLTDSVARLRSQLRETQTQADSQLQSRLNELGTDEREFDPLELDRYTRLQELTRMMAESLHDVQMIQHALLTNSAETEAALGLQGRIGRDLQQHLLELRSVPFGMLSERLQRSVRQTARQLERSAELRIEGESIEIDRSVLQRIAAPLEHMLRNAIAHGIEPVSERQTRGKPAAGRILLRLEQDSNENVLTLADDGAGLDPELIRIEALRLGLLAPSDVVSDSALFHMIFTPGFSTAQTITETSGRGIGLDVVRAEVAAIGGNIEIASTRAEGTTFRIRFPLTLAAAHAIVLRAGGATYAVAANLVEHVQEMKPEALASAYANAAIAWEGQSYPLHYLPQLLGQADRAAEISRRNPVLLLRGGEHRVAIHVDQVVRNQEVVLKRIGAQLARVPGIVGATVLGNGQVVLILNPVQLHAASNLSALRARLPAPSIVTAAAPAAHVMVVDDSLTVRRLTARLLTREGYQVSSAKDGLDALQQLQDVVPDLVIVDIEMPRMDGFELTKALRSDPRMAAIPIIIVTSRLAEKHQRRALDLGVNAFFGKPYPEDELLACVAELLHRDDAARAA